MNSVYAIEGNDGSGICENNTEVLSVIGGGNRGP